MNAITGFDLTSPEKKCKTFNYQLLFHFALTKEKGKSPLTLYLPSDYREWMDFFILKINFVSVLLYQTRELKVVKGTPN